MSRIDRTSGGGSMPIGNAEPAENVKDTSAASQSVPTKPGSAAAESVSIPRPAIDKSAAGELMAAGNRLQSELQKELGIKKPRDFDKEKEMALQVAQNMPRFAPPYVPVGPVVMGDNISAPGQTAAGPMNELNLKPDQFQFNDQGNLVITNEKLIEFFKALKEAPGGGDIRLGFMKMKPPGEE